MGQVIKSTSTFQSGLTGNQKREYHTQSSVTTSNFRSGAGQIGPGSRSNIGVTTTSASAPNQPQFVSGNWQSPRYGANSVTSTNLHPVTVGMNPNTYHISNNNNNHHHQHTNNSNAAFLTGERSAATAAAG